MKELFQVIAKAIAMNEPNAWDGLFVANLIVNAIDKLFGFLK